VCENARKGYFHLLTDSVGMHGGGGGGYGSEVSSIGTSSGGGGPMLSQQPQPEFWCSIAYFELDTQVSRE
jgi:hypothetical protein